MTCTRCGRRAHVCHIVDEQLRQAAWLSGELLLSPGRLCPACLRELLLTPEERQPYLERSS
jgi:hypothetical protein